MCRLFGALAKKPIKLAPWLLGTRNSIKEQSNEHRHGWGIAYLKAGKFRLEKSTLPANKDASFNALSQALKSNIFITHIRKKKFGKLDLRNNQPFLKGKWVFAHNGVIKNYKKALSLVNVRCLKGDTDSELYFQLFLKNMKVCSKELALKETISTLAELRYSSLNFIASDGQKIYALCEYRKEPAYYTMHYLKADNYVLIASEKIGAGKWQKMRNHELMVVDKKCGLKIITI